MRPRALVASSVALALLAIAGSARAQEESETPAGTTAQGTTAQGTASTDETSGAEGEAVVGGTYEPDQRGEHDEPREEAEPAGEASTTYAAPDSAVYEASSPRSFGVDLQLWLGGGLTALEVNGGNLVPGSRTNPGGGAIGASGALRFERLSVGPRVGLTIDPGFLLTNVALGADLMLTDDVLAPYVRASAGITIVDLFGDGISQRGAADIFGVGVEIGAGVRWRMRGGWSLGLELTGAWHHLWRAAVPRCTAGCTEGPFDLRRGGESDALQLRLAITAGWSF